MYVCHDQNDPLDSKILLNGDLWLVTVFLSLPKTEKKEVVFLLIFCLKLKNKTKQNLKKNAFVLALKLSYIYKD